MLLPAKKPHPMWQDKAKFRSNTAPVACTKGGVPPTQVNAVWPRWFSGTHAMWQAVGLLPCLLCPADTALRCTPLPPTSLWMNYVPRKMPDVRSRYARFTIAPIDVRMLRYMDECYGLFTAKINHLHLEMQNLSKMVTKRVVLSRSHHHSSFVHFHPHFHCVA